MGKPPNKGETTVADNTKRTSLDAATEITIAWIQAWESSRPDDKDVTEFFLEVFKATRKADNPSSKWRQQIKGEL